MKTSPENKGKKRLKLNLYMRRKLTVAYMLAAAVLFVFSLYMIVMISRRGEEYQRVVLAQQGYSTASVPFKRGNIVDRNGTLLAYSEEVYNLILDPSVILYSPRKSETQPNRAVTVDAVARIFSVEKSEVERILEENPSSQYVRFARRLSEEDKNRFLDYQSSYNDAEDERGRPLHEDQIVGVWFESEYKRTYPNGTLGSTVLGFSGVDSGEGHWGLEESYNDYLVGVNGKSYAFVNQNGEYERIIEEPSDGKTVVSTIDWYIQSVVEKHIKEFTDKEIYKNVGVVVMDPRNAEILALATDKRFDPGDPTNLSYSYKAEQLLNITDEERGELQNQMWRNFVISDANSPGSVSKELTVAIGLEENVVTPDEKFVCDGGEKIATEYIRCVHTHGTLVLEEGLWYSCNDVMMNIAGRLSAESMVRYQRNLGLGSPTGVDLPGEAGGLIFNEDNMSVVDMAMCSFGQAYSCTMMQMASAYCALVNGGYYYQPRIVRQIEDAGGGLVKKMEPELVRSVITEKISEYIRMAAYNTVQSTSTAGVGRIDGYKIGGKTSTAQKYPIEEGRFFCAYIAFVPADNPQLLVYAVVDEPETEMTEDGPDTSNRKTVLLERAIMEELLPYLGIPKTEQ